MTAAHGQSTARYGALFVLLAAVALFPFLLCSPPPLADYTNHLARAYIIANIDQSPDLARYYDLHWSILPNLALDLVVPPLARLMSIETAQALFLAAGLLLIASGAIAVNAALFGRLSILPFTVFLLLYNRQLLWGLVNFTFSIGMGLWLFAAWLGLRERSAAFKLTVFGLLSTVLFVAHLHALGCYGVLVMTYEAAARLRRESRAEAVRGLAVAAGQFAVPAVLLLCFGETGGRAGDIRFSTPWAKLAGAFDVFNNYDFALDVTTVLVTGGLFALALAFRKVRIHSRMYLPLAVLVALYLVLPNEAFASAGADRRLTVFIAVAFVMSLEWGAASKAWRRVLIGTMLALFVVRMAVIAVHWHRTDAIQQTLLSAIDRIGRGDRLAVVVGELDGEPYLKDPHLDHFGSMAVVRRDAFVNTLFAEPGHQVLRVRYGADCGFSRHPSQTYRVAPAADGFERAEIYGSFPWERFDYLLVVHTRFFAGRPPDSARQVWADAATDCALFRIDG